MTTSLYTKYNNSGELSVLAQLGVTTNKDGTLSIDDAKLSSALET
ncbi:flagellar filament capping protein FliD, partial [Acinetobacter baumannii]